MIALLTMPALRLPTNSSYAPFLRRFKIVLPHSQRTDSGFSRSGDTRRYSLQSEHLNPISSSRNAFATGAKSSLPKLSQELKCTATFTCHCSAFEVSASLANFASRTAIC